MSPGWDMDPLIVALAAGTAFFVALGVLILFFDDLDTKILFGVLFIVIGISLGMYALQFPEGGTVMLALGIAFIVKQALSYIHFY